MSDRKRQFIAGARCPECQALDRLVVEVDAHGQTQRCVACGFSLTERGLNQSIVIKTLDAAAEKHTDP